MQGRVTNDTKLAAGKPRTTLDVQPLQGRVGHGHVPPATTSSLLLAFLAVYLVQQLLTWWLCTLYGVYTHTVFVKPVLAILLALWWPACGGVTAAWSGGGMLLGKT